MENSNNNNESSKCDNDAEDDDINNLTKIPEGKYITFKEEVDDVDYNNINITDSSNSSEGEIEIDDI